MSVAEQVTSILINNLGVDAHKVVPTAKLHDDLGADSLDMIDLAIAIDAELDVMVDDAYLEDMDTVQDLISHVERRMKSNG